MIDTTTLGAEGLMALRPTVLRMIDIASFAAGR